MIDYRLLTHEQLMQENFRLTQIIDNLKKEKEEFDKCTATVYSPNNSYKDFEKKVDKLTEENLSLAKTIECLENKLEESNTAKEKEIDYLWDEIIGPLQQKEQEQKDLEKKLDELTTNNVSLVEIKAHLENKIETLEQEKNQEIDRLIDIMAKTNKEIQKCQTDYYNLKSRNIDLERVIEKQNVVISMAAGYISSCEQFRNDHPINIKKWLMGGME